MLIVLIIIFDLNIHHHIHYQEYQAGTAGDPQ
jgi:hypothetical protein